MVVQMVVVLIKTTEDSTTVLKTRLNGTKKEDEAGIQNIEKLM